MSESCESFEPYEAIVLKGEPHAIALIVRFVEELVPGLRKHAGHDDTVVSVWIPPFVVDNPGQVRLMPLVASMNAAQCAENKRWFEEEMAAAGN